MRGPRHPRALFRDLAGSAALFLLLAAPSAALGELSFTLDTGVHLQADTMEYLKDQNIVLAKGSVHIQQNLVHLYADTIRYDVTAQDIEAKGHVVWQDDTQEIEAKSLNYNLRTKEGKAFNIRTVAPPWISTGSEIDIQEKKVTIKDAVTTTCDYAAGYRHYYLKAGKITIYSGDYLVAENVVLYIGKVPVFYFPFFVRTIHDIRTPFSLTTGSTDYLGNYVLVTTNYLFNPMSYGALFTDYFFKKGFGLGVRHEIALNDYSVLSLYGYGIDQRDDGHFRWESRIRGLWAVTSGLQGRVEADLPGDGFFSQDYSVARRDPTLVSTTREYDISATLSRQQYTLGVLFRRQDSADPTDPAESKFIKNTLTLPQLTFSLFPQALIGKNWLKYDLSLQADHTYTQLDDFYVNHLSGEFGLSQSLVPLDTQTFFSRAAIDEKYQDVSDSTQTYAGESSILNLNETWTGRWSEYLTTMFTHTLTKKLTHLVPGDLPGGITADLLSGSADFTTGSLFRARTSTSYDLNVSVDKPLERFSYLRQEIYLTPSAQFDYLGIADYSLEASAIKDLNTVLNFRSSRDTWRFRVSGNFVDPNVTNTGYTPTGLSPTFEVAGEVDLAFFTNYRISMLESYDLTNSRLETRSISLYRDLHDWEAQLSYSEDPVGGKKVFFTLDLKAFPGRPLTVSNDQLERLNGLRNQGLTGAASQFQ